jgi:hypothetical protein
MTHPRKQPSSYSMLLLFRVLTPCRPLGTCQRFGETYCLHLQDCRWRQNPDHHNRHHHRPPRRKNLKSHTLFTLLKHICVHSSKPVNEFTELAFASLIYSTIPYLLNHIFISPFLTLICDNTYVCMFVCLHETR